MLEDGHETLMLELATGIVSAYVAHNRMPAAELPGLLHSVHGSLDRLGSSQVREPVVEPQQPAVSVKKSVTDDYVICLEDGRKFKSLKRHLASAYGMTPSSIVPSGTCRRTIRWWRRATRASARNSPAGSASAAKRKRNTNGGPL